MTTRLEISRGLHGFRLYLPSGRHLDISADASGARCIEMFLRDADSGRRDMPGYIGAFPTQAITEIWLRQERKAEAIREVSPENRKIVDEQKKTAKLKKIKTKTGIDYSTLEFDL